MVIDYRSDTKCVSIAINSCGIRLSGSWSNWKLYLYELQLCDIDLTWKIFMIPRNLVSLKSSWTTLLPVRNRPWEAFCEIAALQAVYCSLIFVMMINHFRGVLTEDFDPREEVFRYRWSDLRGTARTVVSETFWWYQYFCLTSNLHTQVS